VNAARIGVLVLAVVAAGIAALLARGLMSSGPEEPVAEKVIEEPTTEVLVSASNLQLGEKVRSSDLRWQRWPDAALNPAYITRAQQPGAVEEYSNSVARMGILSGEPVTAEKLVNLSGAGFMSALIEPGMRAIAIEITTKTSAGGFILPNDRVDIVDVDKGQTILRNIRVLAIDQRFNDSGEQVAVGRTATLELTPAQVELVSMASAEGSLALSLRGMSEQEMAGGELDQPGNSVVKVVRNGIAQSVRVNR
jgi:pilus assembly protein CpaB